MQAINTTATTQPVTSHTDWLERAGVGVTAGAVGSAADDSTGLPHALQNMAVADNVAPQLGHLRSAEGMAGCSPLVGSIAIGLPHTLQN